MEMKVPSQIYAKTVTMEPRIRMEFKSSTSSMGHDEQLGNITVGANTSYKPQTSDGGNGDQRPQYSIPGILHFIQHEWARFELERSQWEVDRAEFQVSINTFTFRSQHISIKHFTGVYVHL